MMMLKVYNAFIFLSTKHPGYKHFCNGWSERYSRRQNNPQIQREHWFLRMAVLLGWGSCGKAPCLFPTGGCFFFPAKPPQHLTTPQSCSHTVWHSPHKKTSYTRTKAKNLRCPNCTGQACCISGMAGLVNGERWKQMSVFISNMLH